jgi:hypothetical protein
LRPIDTVCIESGSAEFFLWYSAMPYQAGLVEDRVKLIDVNRVRRIMLGIKEQSDATGVAREQCKIESLLGFVPGCAERPRVSLDSFPSINCGKRSHCFFSTGIKT